MNGVNAQRLYESFVSGGSSYNGVGGRQGFVDRLLSLTGLTTDAEGARHVDLAKRQVPINRLLLEELAYAMIGPDAREALKKPLHEWAYQSLLEDATAAVHPGAFNNISAWNSAVAGLLEVKVLEGYQRPSLISSQLAQTVPTRLRKQKMIGHGIIGNLAEKMKPGQRHPRAQFPERYVETPETEKWGLGIEVTHEAVFFDQTNGGVIQMAETVGYELGLAKEERIIDQFIGVPDIANTPLRYSYGGTQYDTYNAASPWANTHTNPLVDFDDVDDAEQLFVGMTDQEKGQPIVISGRDVLVMPANRMRAQMMFGANAVEFETQSGAVRTIGANPLRGRGWNLLEPSVIVYNRIVASGLATAGNAAQWWFMGDFKRAFAYMENWAMQTKRAAPTDYDMADQDLVFALFVNEMGTPATLEPRAVVRNTH